MYDLNKVMLIGRLTKDPEIRTTPSGTKVANFSLAMTMSKNKDTGEQKTEYIDCVVWDNLAEIVEKYVTKGTQVFIEGAIQTRSWEGTDGKKNYKTEVLAKDIKILTPKGAQMEGSMPVTSNSNSAPSKSKSATASDANELPDINLEEIDLDEIQTPF